MPDFGLTEALSKALSAAKSAPVMRPAEQVLASRAAKAAPAAAAPTVPEAAPSVQTPPSTPTGVQAPPIDPSVTPPDVSAPQPTQTPDAPAPTDQAPGAAAPPGALAASQPDLQAPAPPPKAISDIAPADRLPPSAPPPPEAPAGPTPVQQVAQRFISANMGDFPPEKLNMTHMPNVETMSSPDGMKAAILQVADDNKEAIEASRGKAASNEQLIGLAQDLSVSADTLTQVFDREFGPVADTAGGDQRRTVITAARIVEQNEAGTVMALSDRVASGTATSDEIIQWAQHGQAMVNWRTRLAGASAEAGRNLQVLGMQVGSGLPPEVMDHIAQVIKQNSPDMQATAAAIKMAGTPAGIANILSGMTGSLAARTGKAITGFIQRVFINGILSGPPTWKTVALGNNINLATNAADLYVAGIGRGIYGLAARLGSFPTAEEGVQLSDAYAYMHGIISGGNDALRVAGRVLKSGVTLESLSSKQVSRAAEGMSTSGQNALTTALPELQNSYLGRVVASVEPWITAEAVSGRAISSIDQFTQTLGYRGWVTMRSLQEIRARMTAGTLKPGDAEQVMLDMMNNQSPEMQQEATAWAARQTFQTPFEPGGVGEKMTELLNKAPALRFIFPFMRTATNIVFKQALAERSLLGLFSSRIRSELAQGGVTGDLAKSKMATGTAMAAAYAWMAIHDRATGSAPKDPKERGDWAIDGRTPYSVRVPGIGDAPDQWLDVSKWEPHATIMGAVADAVNLHAYIAGDHDSFSMVAQEDKLTQARSLILASIITNTGNKAFMQGAAQFSEMYNDPKRAFSMWANEVGASMVPYSGMTKFVRNEQDPYLRQALTLLDKIRDDLPKLPMSAGSEPRTPDQQIRDARLGKLPQVLGMGGSQQLIPRLDVFGEPRVRQGGNAVLGPLNPLPASSSKKDALTDEVQSLMEQTHVVPITMPTQLLALDGNGKGMEGGGGMRLTPEEYYDYVRFARESPIFNSGTQTFRERLQQTMNLPVYKADSPPMRVELLGAIARDADKLGAWKLYHENTDFRERMTAWTAEANRQKFNR